MGVLVIACQQFSPNTAAARVIEQGVDSLCGQLPHLHSRLYRDRRGRICRSATFLALTLSADWGLLEPSYEVSHRSGWDELSTMYTQHGEPPIGGLASGYPEE